MIGPFAHIEHYDPRPFAFARDRDHYHIDDRHLQVLFALASELRPRAAVEIGCFHGYSSAAFVAMLNAGFVEEIHFVDPNRTDQFDCVLAHARLRQHVHVHHLHSENMPVIDADFWLIDGNHGPPALLDLERALSARPDLIALHDTNGEHDEPVGWRQSVGGAIEAGQQLAARPEYTTIHDHRDRRARGEQTVRGLTIGLRTDSVSPETIDFARALLTTDRVWWPHSALP